MPRDEQTIQQTMQNPDLDRCKSYIEQRLRWGDASDWTTQDFEDLSLRIQEETGRAISATTLKRLWGRVAYHSSPSRHSLDTLALFVGHASWRDYLRSADGTTPSGAATPGGTPADVATEVIPPMRAAPSTTRRVRYMAVVALSLCFGMALWAGLKETPSDLHADASVPTAVTFLSRPVTSGVPNTVIFDYDVGQADADSFFIQQSWDQRRRALVAPEHQTYTSTYYRPGFFNAKLLADDRVLAEHPVHITTDGWIALIEAEPTPSYLTDILSSSEGALSVEPALLSDRGHDPEEEYRVLEYYNVRTFGVRADGFSLETALRRTVADGRYPCGPAEVSVLGERGAFQIPLGQAGCVGDMNLLLGMHHLGGKTNDLSAFGVDLSSWQRVRLGVRGDDVRIQVGTNAPFTARMEEDMGQVVGLRFRFGGAGAIDYVTLYDADGAVVYDEAF
ncbi:MAG: hypothetical protein AAFP18_06360 [Bacteroidota bacterium]